MTRVVLTGSESTGKTTLALRIAQQFNAAFIPEFVREFAAKKGSAIDFGDHGAIARGQMALEDSAAERNPRLIVQDTDLLSTVVYCDHYFGRCPEWIDQTARQRRPDLYLLMEIDVPWVADGVRDRGHLREEVQQLFRNAVASSGARYEVISGSWEERHELATTAIRRLLDEPISSHERISS